MRGTLGFFGTGIWPFSISRSIGAQNMSVQYGSSRISSLSRDYFSVLYLPIFPLGLSALADIGNRRVSLNREGKATVVGATTSVYGTRSAEREAAMAWIRAPWILAFLVCILGAALGYFVAGYFLGGWQPGLYNTGGALLGSVIANRIFISAIGYSRNW